MLEFVKPSKITQNDIIDAIAKMQERGEFPNVLVTTQAGLYHLTTLPGYTNEFMYGKRILEKEMGAIEGLMIEVLPNLPDGTMYVACVNLGK